MFLRCDKWRKSRRMPNVSCFVQSVFSLMTSSQLVVVQSEAAALLVELTTAPQVLEAVERCYLKIISRNDIDDTLRKIILERLKIAREKKSVSTQFKKQRKPLKIIEI